MRIAEIVLHRLGLPLTKPYRISITDIRAFDTVLVEVIGDDGGRGFGEATLLADLDVADHRAQGLAARHVGLRVGGGRRLADVVAER